ncbi:MAG: hypothetical protein ACK55I_06855, partial [bacterium]
PDCTNPSARPIPAAVPASPTIPLPTGGAVYRLVVVARVGVAIGSDGSPGPPAVHRSLQGGPIP